MIPTGTERIDGAPCPCGCGMRLLPYNGVRSLVCQSVWRMVEKEDRWGMFHGNERGLEDSARRILSIAAVVRRDREATGRA